MPKYKTDNDNINIDFSKFPFCFRSVKVKDYTNMLKDSSQFFKFFKRILEIELPIYVEYTFDDIVFKTKKHSHSIPMNTKEYELVINILKELYKSYKDTNYSDKDFELFLDNNINEYQLWQLGISSIRLFGIRRSNIFSVLFIDYHHLVYPDKNYNQKNYEKYVFCPMTNNN